MSESWRVVAICSINPIAEALVGALRELGHDPVAILSARLSGDGPRLPEHLELTRYSAPAGLDLLFPRDKHSIEPLLRAYEPTS